MLPFFVDLRAGDAEETFGPRGPPNEEAVFCAVQPCRSQAGRPVHDAHGRTWRREVCASRIMQRNGAPFGAMLPIPTVSKTIPDRAPS
ncbi:MAG: hypothetical protein MI921_00020 [Cytophagales bacterium]|nr:hypothetical protein [Cytophagales bacterium]